MPPHVEQYLLPILTNATLDKRILPGVNKSFTVKIIKQ